MQAASTCCRARATENACGKQNLENLRAAQVKAAAACCTHVQMAAHCIQAGTHTFSELMLLTLVVVDLRRLRWGAAYALLLCS